MAHRQGIDGLAGQSAAHQREGRKRALPLSEEPRVALGKQDGAGFEGQWVRSHLSAYRKPTDFPP